MRLINLHSSNIIKYEKNTSKYSWRPLFFQNQNSLFFRRSKRFLYHQGRKIRLKKVYKNTQTKSFHSDLGWASFDHLYPCSKDFSGFFIYFMMDLIKGKVSSLQHSLRSLSLQLDCNEVHGLPFSVSTWRNHKADRQQSEIHTLVLHKHMVCGGPQVQLQRTNSCYYSKWDIHKNVWPMVTWIT